MGERDIALDKQWLCVVDPSGCFRGGLFSQTDIIYTARGGNWPTGITWINQKTNKKLVYAFGKLNDKSPNQVKQSRTHE